MLIQFTLKNYKLFKNETLLDFLPASIHEHKASLLEDMTDQEHFLPILSVYGPNGCGKSTLLEGLSKLSSFVTGDSSLLSPFHPVYHRFSPECMELPVEFDVLFRSKSNLFRYQLRILRGAVAEENLFFGRLNSEDTGILFSRKGSRLHLGPQMGMSREALSSSLSQSLSLLSLAASKSDSPYIQAAFSWFKQIRFFSFFQDGIPFLPEEENQKGVLCRLLQDMDLDIRDYCYKSQPEKDKPQLFLIHGKPGDTLTELPYWEESSGTRKLLHFLPDFLASLSQGSLLLADDLDSVLHPHLLLFLIDQYKSRYKNPLNAQLLFTSHNTAILTPARMRRDEILLCCRPEGGEAVLYPLSSYKKENGLIPRNDEAYGKQYLEGRYGAVPKLTSDQATSVSS